MSKENADMEGLKGREVPVKKWAVFTWKVLITLLLIPDTSQSQFLLVQKYLLMEEVKNGKINQLLS